MRRPFRPEVNELGRKSWACIGPCRCCRRDRCDAGTSTIRQHRRYPWQDRQVGFWHAASDASAATSRRRTARCWLRPHSRKVALEQRRNHGRQCRQNNDAERRTQCECDLCGRRLHLYLGRYLDGAHDCHKRASVPGC